MDTNVLLKMTYKKLAPEFPVCYLILSHQHLTGALNEGVKIEVKNFRVQKQAD